MIGLVCAIVGLPNVGKTTLFNALTGLDCKTGNFLFCTTEPRSGDVALEDQRLHLLSRLVGSVSISPSRIRFVDTPGMVPVNFSGKRRWTTSTLESIGRADVVLHVIRFFEDDDVVRLGGVTDPVDDLETLDTELILSDISTCERNLKKLAAGRSGRQPDRIDEEVEILERMLSHLGAGDPVRSLDLDDIDLDRMKHLNLLTAKPTLYVANISDRTKSRPYANLIGEKLGRRIFVNVGKIGDPRGRDVDMLDEERPALRSAGVDDIVRSCVDLLSIRFFFTIRRRKISSWAVGAGTTALRAAGMVHSDFERKFIRVRVVRLDDLVRLGDLTRIDVGRHMKTEGKEYLVQDGDVLEFLFG